MDLKILKETDSLLSFELGTPSKVSGVEALVQQVVVELISDYNPILGRGASIQSLVYSSSPSEVTATKARISSAISSARANLLATQQDATELKASERLKDLRPLAIESLDGLSWNIKVQIETFAGDIVTTAVTV